MTKKPSVTKHAPQQFFFIHQEREIGPATIPELQEQARMGKLVPDDLIWRLGSEERRAARHLLWLFPRSNDKPSTATVAGECSIPQLGLAAPVRVQTPDTLPTPPVRLPVGRDAGPIDYSMIAERSGARLQEATQFLREAATVTIEYFREWMAFVKRAIMDKSTELAAMPEWPQDQHKSLRLAVGCSLCVVCGFVSSYLFQPASAVRTSRATAQVPSKVPSPAPASAWMDQYKQRQAEQQDKRDREIAANAQKYREAVTKGDKLLATGKLHAAQTAYEQAIALDGKASAAHIGLANTFSQMNEPSKVVDSLWKAFHQSTQDKPLQLSLLERIAGVHSEQGEFDGAVRAMDRAIQLEPEQGEYRYTAGVASWNAKNYRPAVKYLEAALEYFELAGQSGEPINKTCLHLAKAHRQLKETPRALHYCDRVLAADSEHHAAHCVRGVIYAQDNLVDKAASDYRCVARNQACKVAELVSFADAFRQHRQWEQALLVYSDIMQKEPERGEWVYHRASVAVQCGKYDIAKADCQYALKLMPKDNPMWNKIQELNSTVATLTRRGITLDILQQETRDAAIARHYGPGPSQNYAPARSAPRSPYGYLTPNQAGRLGAMGIHLGPR